MRTDLLLDLLDVESVPDFLLDNTKVNTWMDGSEIRGQAPYGVHFPHGEYPNISQPMVGPQTNNRAEVSAVRAAISVVREDQELCIYSDSKWCVDIFDNLQLYKRRGWMSQGKKQVGHHDVWEEVLSLIQCRSAPVTVTHVYAHNKVVYNDAADELAKAGASLSEVHRPVRPKKSPKDGPQGSKAKYNRGRGVKPQAAVQVSNKSTDGDRSILIHHRRRRMQNAPLELPDPEPG